jgi:hypothetical protein
MPIPIFRFRSMVVAMSVSSFNSFRFSQESFIGQLFYGSRRIHTYSPEFSMVFDSASLAVIHKNGRGK